MAKAPHKSTPPPVPREADDDPSFDPGPFDMPRELAEKWRGEDAELDRARAVLDSHVDRAQAKAIAAELAKVNRAQTKAIAVELAEVIAVDRSASGKLIAAEVAKAIAVDRSASGKLIAAEVAKAIAVDRSASGKLIAAEVAKAIAVDRSASGTGTKAWIAAEIVRLRAAGLVRGSIRITKLAQLLEQQMRKAAAGDSSLRVVTWRHIKNRLPDWGLWPITDK